MEKCNIRHIWLSIPQVISICTFLPLANLSLLMILLDFQQKDPAYGSSAPLVTIQGSCRFLNEIQYGSP